MQLREQVEGALREPVHGGRAALRAHLVTWGEEVPDLDPVER